MSNRSKNFSTIIVTGKNHETNSFTIKTRYVKHFKGYVLAVISLVFMLSVATVGLSFYVSNQKIKANNLELQVLRLQNVSPAKKQAPAISDSALTHNYINQIQSKLNKINTYLKARGVKGFSSAGTGGNYTSDANLTPQEKLELYEEYVTRLSNGLELIPLGYPHLGNITSVYGYRSNPFIGSGNELHSGLDFHGETGEQVKSTASGRVVWSSWFQGYGNCVRIAHGNGYQTLYGHLSAIKVKAGQKVRAGEVIGLIGSTGRSTGPHLHYEVRLNNKPLNPNKFLSL